jgi:apolipoprotein N-acyltransferase
MSSVLRVLSMPGQRIALSNTLLGSLTVTSKSLEIKLVLYLGFLLKSLLLILEAYIIKRASVVKDYSPCGAFTLTYVLRTIYWVGTSFIATL